MREIPSSSWPRASRATEWSRRSVPRRLPITPSARTAIFAPADPPSIIVANATGSSEALAPATAPRGPTASSSCSWTKTRTVPPHIRPTSAASSSDTPYVTSRGSPPSRIRCASSTSAPSTHPPVTDPSMLVRSSTSIWAPGSSGADPMRSTRVALTTRRPSRSQSAAMLSVLGGVVTKLLHRQNRPRVSTRGGPHVGEAQRAAGGTTPDEEEGREKGEWGATADEGVVPPDLGGSDAPREMLPDDPELDSEVLGQTTGSDEPATEGGIDLGAGDESDAN